MTILRDLTFIGRDWEKHVLTSHLKRGFPERAYLFCGVKGLGKRFIARDLIKSFNCKGCSEKGDCVSCRKIDSGRCEDVIELEKPTVEELDLQIRPAIVRSPIESKFRFIVLNLTVMSPEVEGALLKILEEPVSKTSFVLFTESLRIFKPILSRAFVIEPPVLSATQFSQLFNQGADAWEICGGVPGRFKNWKQLSEWYDKIKEFFRSGGKISVRESVALSKFMTEEGSVEEKVRLWISVLVSEFLKSESKLAYEVITERTSKILECMKRDVEPGLLMNHLLAETKVALLNMSQ